MRRDDVGKGHYTDTYPKADTVYFGAGNSDRTADNDTGGNGYSGRNTDSAADGRFAGNFDNCTDTDRDTKSDKHSGTYGNQYAKANGDKYPGAYGNRHSGTDSD